MKYEERKKRKTRVEQEKNDPNSLRFLPTSSIILLRVERRGRTIQNVRLREARKEE